MAQNVKLIDPGAGNSETILPLVNFVQNGVPMSNVQIGTGSVNATWRFRVNGTKLVVEELTGVNTWTEKGAFV